MSQRIPIAPEHNPRAEEDTANHGGKRRVRRGLIAVGQRLPDIIVSKVGNLVKEVELRKWMTRHGLSMQTTVKNREQLFDLVGREIGDVPTLYIELGVARGDATRIWSKLLKHPATLLHGFDSFEGLPENWEDGSCPPGTFSTGGALPKIDDARVQFFKGWFSDTLLTYRPPSRPATVLNMDADLYSSTILALRTLKDVIEKGTYIYFDEFCSHGHEERAFREFVDETGLTFSFRGGTADLTHVLFQCTGRRAS